MLKKIVGIMLVLVLMASTVAGCGNSDTSETKEKVDLAYVSWSDSVVVTALAAVVLEDKMGYEVEMTLADIAPVLASVASGDSDAYLDVWLPYTHANYIEEYGDDMVDLGVLYGDAKSGLVVPSYVDIDSIEELNANKDLFDGEIIGIDPGAGLMGLTEDVVAEFELDYTIQSGSATTMTAALAKAIENEEPIVVTGWAPHWKFTRWDLKFLEDPKGTYGETESAYKYVRKNLKEDLPEVAEFIENYKLDVDDVAEMMGALEENPDNPKEVVREWMNENEELVNSWIPETE
jgi:glycine betaine/proline transport system substrate-binding protein